jgi:hypothetical protein
MARSITLTMEKSRLEFDRVQNKRNTDLLTCILEGIGIYFIPHNDFQPLYPLKYPNVN